MGMRRFAVVTAAVGLLGLGLVPGGAAGADTGQATRYVVVLAGDFAADGTFQVAAGGTQAALALVNTAGGAVAVDLSRQIGVLVVDSPNALFADTLRASDVVEEVGKDFKWKAFPSYEEALAAGMTVVPDGKGGGGPEQTSDPLESMQWSMIQIRAPQAHKVQAGWRAVDVGILDTGIDGAHLDFVLDSGGTNVDCARGRDFIPEGPGIGNPAPCVDDSFHGTHVAGIVAAQANGHGVVGVAPNVTLVAVKVCDSSGYCYSSATTAGITYAGDAKLDVINMSFFVDDDELLESTEFKCLDDPEQRAFRKANERALKYAVSQGVTPVAALGNSENNLAQPPDQCAVVPAESPGVIGTAALGPQSELSYYSNYGLGAVDVAAPGGSGTTGDCETTVLSSIPGNVWGCFQGTSMASPHATGVAALIVSQFGAMGSDGDVKIAPSKVQSLLQATAVDIGLAGYDKCFGNGRVDALRAVRNDTSKMQQAADCDR